MMSVTVYDACSDNCLTVVLKTSITDDISGAIYTIPRLLCTNNLFDDFDFLSELSGKCATC